MKRQLRVRKANERFIAVVKLGGRRRVVQARQILVVNTITDDSQGNLRLEAEPRPEPTPGRDGELEEQQVLDVPVRLGILRLVIGDVLDVELCARRGNRKRPRAGLRWE